MKRVAVVGATGAVGSEFRAVLAQRGFPAASYRLFASPASAGRPIEWVDGVHKLEALAPRCFEGIDVALFSAGGSISREYAPAAAKAGALVIDNSSAFRMNTEVPLVVPEVNAGAAKRHQGIIANPNCSTIILAVAVWPLHRVNRVRRIVVSTYQAVSGAGAKAMAELESQTRDVLSGQSPRCEVFAQPCAFNVFSHNSAMGADGYNLEESKLIHETRKIFDDARIQVAPTCMRVPVMRAHTESLSLEFERAISEDEARRILSAAPGVRVVDDRGTQHFPTPLLASGMDDVLVGRIRQDPSVAEARGLQLICSGDQLRKGAALNAVQIAELFL